MKRIAFVSAVLALSVAYADTIYTEEGTVLVATVDATETNELDAAYAAKLKENKYTLFEKRGDGGLFMPDDISDYMGAVTVRAGSLGYRKSTSLGSLAAGNGDVTVIAGATLFIPDNLSANSVSPLGKSFLLAGMGVGDVAGAVDIRSEQQRCPMGTNITLLADTRIRNRTQYYWGSSWNSVAHRCRLNMGRYVLRLNSEGSMPSFMMVDVENPGRIVIESSPSISITSSRLGGSESNEVQIEMAPKNDLTPKPTGTIEWE